MTVSSLAEGLKKLSAINEPAYARFKTAEIKNIFFEVIIDIEKLNVCQSGNK